ncbi:reverse transcriptase, partial [Colletotrichum higginsianum]
MVVFSDGSRATNGAVGYGFVIYRGSRSVAQGRGRLGLAEVFDAEVEAGAHMHRQHQRHPGYSGETPDSSQEAFLEIQEAVRMRDLQTHWAPGHQGIEGNEAADKLAKEETTLQ